jgi:hypothetical protein
MILLLSAACCKRRGGLLYEIVSAGKLVLNQIITGTLLLVAHRTNLAKAAIIVNTQDTPILFF